MINNGYFKGKEISVIGLARSGLACANLLSALGARVSVSDNQDNSSTRANAALLSPLPARLELGRHTPEFIRGQDLVVVSPGVPDTSAALAWAKEYSIPVISEIEVGSILCPAALIAVTGSCGKTTVTTLIGRALEEDGKKAFVCGNIGTPFTLVVSQMAAGDFAVLEASSFQLEHIRFFRPKVALILNFSRNHLDRYRDLSQYLKAKKRIFLNQAEGDCLVLNAEDPALKETAACARARVSYFSRSREFSANQAAVLAVCSALGVGAEPCLRAFAKFRGLEHRFEFVREVGGVTFINDSKATTAESCLMALENIASPVVLIAGGRDKGVDYRAVLESAEGKVRKAILIGEASGTISRAFSGRIALEEAGSMEEAVRKAYCAASCGDRVLLSPMCSSFDMFADYEERGRVFKQIVLGLAEK